MKAAEHTAARPTSIPVLMYHDVADRAPRPGFRPFVVPPSLLEEHLDALAGAGYRTAPVSALTDESVCADGSMVFVTFDDAYASFGRHVVPLLERFDMTATLFVPTAFVGKKAEWLRPLGEDSREILGWRELREIHAAGFEIGSHSHRHPQLDTIRRMHLLTELRESRRILETALDAPVRTMAYPFGYNDRTVRGVARRSGYDVSCGVDDALHRAGSDPMRVRRLLIGPDVSGEELLARLRRERSGAIRGGRALVRPLWRTARRARTLAGREAA